VRRESRSPRDEEEIKESKGKRKQWEKRNQDVSFVIGWGGNVCVGESWSCLLK
jgi:hypothetical protein